MLWCTGIVIELRVGTIGQEVNQTFGEPTRERQKRETRGQRHMSALDVVCKGKETKGQGDTNLALDVAHVVVCKGQETKDQEGITSALDVVLAGSRV